VRNSLLTKESCAEDSRD